MQNFIKIKIFLALAAIVFVAILLLFLLPRNTPKKETSSIKPLPIPSDVTKDYSNLYHVLPGKSTLEDVKKINGNPASISTFGDKTYLYYNTPLNQISNTVLLINNRVVYSYENVFGDYRGTIQNFIDSYGQAHLKMYKKEDPYVWYMYPDRGIGVESDGRDVLVIVYFVPMSEEDFVKNLAPDLKLLTEQPPVSE